VKLSIFVVCHHKIMGGTSWDLYTRETLQIMMDGGELGDNDINTIISSAMIICIMGFGVNLY
jgi:hypothetical protein